MPDDRDKLTRKRAPAHVRAQTAGTQPPRAPYPYTYPDPEHDPAAPDREMTEWDCETPVFPQMDPARGDSRGDPAAAIARVEWRQKRQSVQMVSVRDHAAKMAAELADVKAQNLVVTKLLAKSLEDAATERRAREEERQRAKDRDAADEIAKTNAKLESKKLTLSIVVPTISALGATIAAIIAAVAASGRGTP